MAGAHYYMSEIHNFHTSELEYLLQFQNPLQVVGDAFQISGMDDYSDVMWDIFDRQDALQGDYPLMPEPTDEAALRQNLFDKVERNFRDNLESFRMAMTNPGTTDSDVIDLSAQMSRINNAHHFLTSGAYPFKEGKLEFLASLEHPLDVIVSEVYYYGDHSYTADEMRGHLRNGSINDKQLIKSTAASQEPLAEKRVDTSEKSSVMEQLRAVAKAPKEPHKDKPSRDKSGPER
jgi:hypothetical protein